MTSPIEQWFIDERGIQPETLAAWNVTIDEDGTVLMPYPNGLIKRRRNPFSTNGPRFQNPKGSTLALFAPPERQYETRVAFMCEGETDAMRLWQAFQDDGKNFFVTGLPGSQAWSPDFVGKFEPYDSVFVILDNDEDYMVQAQTNKAWKEIRHDLGKKAKKLVLPGVKDVCEFFELYDLDTMRKLTARPPQGKSRYSPLDLNKPAPPPNWLVEGLIAMGDVTLLHGREGLGKSFVTKALSVAIVEGWESFLGLPVLKQGRVLYIDQENPEDDVRRRLEKLGASEHVKSGQLRYLSHQHIRLDRDPDTLLEEVHEFEPVLIIIDSFTRVHTQDENSAGAMSALYNDGLQPLARDTGAALVIIHHDNKMNEARGSGDILASPDNILHVKSVGNNSKFLLEQGKTRRRRGGGEMVIEIRDMEDGSISLDAEATVDPPF